MSESGRPSIRAADDADRGAILELNQESVEVLSPLDDCRLELLHGMAEALWVAEDERGIRGFLMAFAPGADYDSVNYRWFDRRYDDFLYVDRVVVDAGARGLGIGSLLYRQLEAHARETGRRRIVAEVDEFPPNVTSLAFHRRRGFEIIGGQQIAAGKRVAMLSRPLARSPLPGITS